MHGMPVGLLMESLVSGDYHSNFPGLEWLGEKWEGDNLWDGYSDAGPPRLNPKDIVYVGLRDVDSGERQLIREFGIKAYTMYDVDRLGIGQVMDKALNHLLSEDPNRPLHCSYDIDAVDPINAPATGTTVRGGLTYREANFVAERIWASGRLQSADLVELNPMLSDKEGVEETVELGFQIAKSLMGNSII